MNRIKRTNLLLALTMLATALLAGTATAQDRADSPQIAAATTEAIDNLRERIERTPLAGRVNVAEFLRATGGNDDLTKLLARAELVGGPRWVDADTCQIQLEISGQRVAHALQQIAANHPRESPFSARTLQRETEDWDRKTFTGTGSSTAFGRIAKVRAPAVGGWASVSEADRQKTLAAAKADAIDRVIDSIKPIELAKGKTVGDALTNTKVRADLTNWLESRPVTRVEYRRDLQIELSMAGTPHGCFDVIRRAVTKYTDLPIPRDDAGWSDIKTEFERRMASPIGHAGAPAPIGTAAAPPPRFHLPSEPPIWLERKLEIEGLADPGNSKLKAARVAEKSARLALADEIGRLTLSNGMTLAKAAEQNPHLNDAISKALDKAKSKTDYNHRRGVSVILQLDLRDLWDALREAE